MNLALNNLQWLICIKLTQLSILNDIFDKDTCNSVCKTSVNVFGHHIGKC